MCAAEVIPPAALPNILLGDIKPLPENSLEMAQALYLASLTRRGPPRQLEKWEEVESAVTNVVIVTESEAEVGLDCLSAIRQRLSERAATPAALGAMYAKSLRLSSGAVYAAGSHDGAVAVGTESMEDFGWLKRTLLIASTLDMETEGLFAALQHYLGWKFPHATLPTLNEAGDIIQRPAHIEHVPILISRFPARPAHATLCRALFSALQKTLGNLDFAAEERRMRVQGNEPYIRYRLMAHQVSLLVLTGFADEHLQLDLPEVWTLLKQFAHDGVVIALLGSPAMQLQTTRPEFVELFPQAPLNIVGYDERNFANIAAAYWGLLQIPGPMPEALIDICAKVRARRGPLRRVFLLINQRVNRYGMALKAVVEDVKALVDEACAGLYSIILDELELLDEPDHELTPERCRELIDYLPYETSFDVLSRDVAAQQTKRVPNRRRQIRHDD